MSKDLYILKNIEVINSFRDNLCWAACIEMPHRMVFGITNNFQQNAVQKYKESICYNDLKLNHNSDNIEIQESCLKPIFNRYGFEIEEKHTEITNFNFYVKQLKETGLPLLLGIDTGQGLNENGHLVLICGYGYCNGNRYLLVFDPNISGYQEFNKFNDNNNLVTPNKSVRLWTLNSPDASNFKNENNIKKIDFENSVQLFSNKRDLFHSFSSQITKRFEVWEESCYDVIFFTDTLIYNHINKNIQRTVKNNNLEDYEIQLTEDLKYIIIEEKDLIYPINFTSSNEITKAMDRKTYNKLAKEDKLPTTIKFNK